MAENVNVIKIMYTTHKNLKFYTGGSLVYSTGVHKASNRNKPSDYS